MAEQTYFMLYFDYREHLELLSDEERGRLLTSLFDYAERGTMPELSGAAKMAFSFIRSQIDRDFARYKERCARNRENGKLGGKPKQTERLQTEPTATEEYPDEANKANTKKKKKTNTKTNTKEKTSAIPQTPLPDATDILNETVREWLTYKHERGEGYTETGLQSLLTRIRNQAAQHGDAPVCDIIHLSMENSWKGIIWDRLEKQATEKPGTPPNGAAQLGDWEREQMERVKAHRRAASCG